MHPSFNTYDECDRLNGEMARRSLDEVGISFAKSKKPDPPYFFVNLNSATARITELIKDMEVNGLWISVKTERYNELHAILVKLNKLRPFSGMTFHDYRGYTTIELL